jgi:chromosome segregation ATPase
MRVALFSVIAVSVCCLADGVHAQSKLLRRPKSPLKKEKKESPLIKKGRPDICTGQGAVLAEEQQRLESYRAERAGVDGEMSELRRRLSDLERRQRDLATLVQTQKRRVDKASQVYKANCERSETCTQYEEKAGILERQADPVEKELSHVHQEISRTQSEVKALEGQIDPLRREYQSKGCGQLVPGQTQQSTIDRCSAIFSDWNRQQTDLNRHSNRLPELKRRFEQLLTRLASIESRAKGYETYLARNCSRSSKLVRLRGYGGVHRRAQTLGKELDRLIGDVTRLRGIRITVE